MHAAENRPGQPAEKQPNQPMNLGAVVAGWAVDIGGSMLVSIAIGVILALVMLAGAALSGTDLNQVQYEAGANALVLTMPFLLASMVMGCMTTVLGGFVSGYMAKRDEIWHALATGTLSLLTGLLLIATNHAAGANQQPLWYTLLGILLTYPCALLGGWLCVRRRLARRH